MKKILSLLLVTVLMFALCAPAMAAGTASSFSDVPAGSWYAEYVDVACEAGLMKGMGGNKFSPEGSLTVAEAITLAARLHNMYHGNSAVLENGSPWYQPYVDYAKENGILEAGRSYSYNAPINRKDFALLISNALPDSAIPAINNIPDGAIPDVSAGRPLEDAFNALLDAGIVDTGGYYWSLATYIAGGNPYDAAGAAVYRLYRAGLLTGNDKYGTYAPYTNIKRCEVAAILSRVVDVSQRKSVSLEEKPVSLVPVSQLANKASLQKRATDAQLAEAYDMAVYPMIYLSNLSVEAQLYGIAIALRAWTEALVEYSMSAPNYNDPYGFFVRGAASCAGCTRATGLCLNMLGIPYEHVNPDAYTHQWTRINVGGTYWICDAYGLYCGPEPAPYQHPRV